MESESNIPPRRRVPKLGHKKSMFGCQRCRSRRVKCNEEKPICYNCKRHGLPCNYDRDTIAKKVSPKPAVAQVFVNEPEENDPPESRSRRMLEARLMHQYVTETGLSIAADERTLGYFSRLIPKLSFHSDALLYSMYCLAALNIARVYGDGELEDGAENVANRYFSMAVREHNKEIFQVNKDTTDIVCLTSCLMRAAALIQIQTRNREPYTPPWQWLALTHTSTATFVEAYKQIGPDPNSVAFQLIRGTSHLHDNGKLPQSGDIQRLQHLLDRSKELSIDEEWDSEIQDGYERTLTYICNASRLSDAEGSSSSLFRMLLMFPMLADERYIKLVKKESPRALVVLAHYFALLSRFSDVWWVANIGADEVRAIANSLPEEWQGLLVWPLEKIKQWNPDAQEQTGSKGLSI
ncbi:C6 finger domain-containing protein [Annulohypoxylon maeteangense]|uniref:C6 finger domain-containing protein n=1 Tax=Annulohypoxylon maeteangense TaxID=1927788 RepID=UPI0020082941|nr:C6 finger domain-containing protein [Annulohypoxylon maeteangense]KAI0881993.1 C6 finger domain-containing protein [Annulohypoxylon maeteangense]